MSNKDYPFDARLEHRAIAQAALTADATVDTIVQKVAQRTEYLTRFSLESIDVADADEHYEFIIEVSNDSFSTVEVAAHLSLGATAARIGGAPDNVAGDRYDVCWNTEVNDVVYKDARIRLDVSGTSPSVGLSCFSSIC